MLFRRWVRVDGSTPWARASSAFWASGRALRSSQSSGIAKVRPDVGAVTAWWPAGTEGAALPEALAPPPLDDVAAAAGAEPVAVAAAEPADEGLVCEQPARMRMVARARVARVVLMVSPG